MSSDFVCLESVDMADKGWRMVTKVDWIGDGPERILNRGAL